MWYSEIYGRILRVGDYVLFTDSPYKSLQYLILGKVGFSLGTLGVEYYINSSCKFSVSISECYKIEGCDTELLEKCWKEGRDYKEVYVPDCFLYKEIKLDKIKCMLDVFGREVKIGDFVGYMDNTNLSQMYYGIVIDNMHVLDNHNVKKRAVLVCLVTKPVKEELQIYNNICSYNNQSVYFKLKNTSVITMKHAACNRNVGDMYRKGNIIYLYLGRYAYSYMQHSYDVKSNLDKLKGIYVMDMELYIAMNLETKAGQKSYAALLKGDITGFEDFLKVSRCQKFPSQYKYDISSRTLGEYIGDSHYKPKDEYLVLYKNTVCYRFRKA